MIASGPMDVLQIAEGLWRWTAPHPAWKPENDLPGGWGRMVGCVYYEPPGGDADALVLIDPLAPPEGSPEAERFWRHLDADVERAGLPIAVLLSNRFHSRSAATIVERYGEARTTLWGDPVIWSALRHLRGRDLRDEEGPGGVRAFSIEGLEPSETAFYIAPHRTIVFADAVLGAGGGRLRVAPESWAQDTPEGKALYRAAFRPSLRRLASLAIDSVLTSHGASVLEAGNAALAEALDAPAWGA